MILVEYAPTQLYAKYVKEGLCAVALTFMRKIYYRNWYQLWRPVSSYVLLLLLLVAEILFFPKQSNTLMMRGNITSFSQFGNELLSNIFVLNKIIQR